MQRVSNKEVNIGDVYFRPSDNYPPKATVLTTEEGFYFPFYQISEYIGKYQVRVKAISLNPFFKDDEWLCKFDNRCPYIKNSYIYHDATFTPIFEFKAWVLETGDLRKVDSDFLNWELWEIYDE